MPSLSEADRTLGFYVHDVARLLRRNFDRRLQSLGLTQAQWRAIAHLSREPGLKQAALAERLEVKPITLTRLIDRMEAAGWVERQSHPEDRRASLLYLTRKTRPILNQMHRRAADTLEEALAGLSPALRRGFGEALQRIKQNLLKAENAGAGAHVTTADEVEQHGGKRKTKGRRRR
jgi:DNA-binding MarR family transcriptional regulator